MGRRIAFFVIISVAILFAILLAFLAIFNGWTDVRIKELQEKVATLQSEANRTAEVAINTQSDLKATIALQQDRFTATVQSLNTDIGRISQTATSTAREATMMTENFTRLSATATSMVATVTAQAPEKVLVKEQQEVSLFGDELTIKLQGYSSLISSDITFTVQSPNSVSQTFDDVGLGEVVLYKGSKNYTVLVSDNFKDEEGYLNVEFIVAGN